MEKNDQKIWQQCRLFSVVLLKTADSFPAEPAQAYRCAIQCLTIKILTMVQKYIFHHHDKNTVSILKEIESTSQKLLHLVEKIYQNKTITDAQYYFFNNHLIKLKKFSKIKQLAA